jgi:hypothetical protein
VSKPLSDEEHLQRYGVPSPSAYLAQRARDISQVAEAYQQAPDPEVRGAARLLALAIWHHNRRPTDDTFTLLGYLKVEVEDMASPDE